MAHCPSTAHRRPEPCDRYPECADPAFSRRVSTAVLLGVATPSKREPRRWFLQQAEDANAQFPTAESDLAGRPRVQAQRSFDEAWNLLGPDLNPLGHRPRTHGRHTAGFTAAYPEESMFQDENDAGWEREARWPWWRPPEPDALAFRDGGTRFFARVRLPKDNVACTRVLLARDVYRIPEAWLDEVVRVRLADLRRN
jgi:hypothetical protein